MQSELRSFCTPPIEVVIVFDTRADQEKVSGALNSLIDEDPSIQVRTNPEMHETTISGSDLTLDTVADRVVRELAVRAAVGRPQVCHRETISRTARRVEGRCIRRKGGSGQYAIVYLDVDPAPGKGSRFVSEIEGGTIPAAYLPAVRQGVERGLSAGPKAGFPMADVRVTLVDGKFHDTDSSDFAFMWATLLAFEEAAKRAAPVLLEPIFAVEVVVPEDHLGDVVGDLSRRRGRITGQHRHGDALRILATAPGAELLGYATDLRSTTQGRASCVTRFARYEAAP